MSSTLTLKPEPAPAPEAECSICLEVLESDIVAPCKDSRHRLHNACYVKLYEHAALPSCPLCRREYTSPSVRSVEEQPLGMPANILIITTIYIIINSVFSIAVVVIGALNMENCITIHQLPLWAVIHGGLSIGIGAFYICAICRPLMELCIGLSSLCLTSGLCTWIWGMILLFTCRGECPAGCNVHLYKIGLAMVYIPWVYIVLVIWLVFYNSIRKFYSTREVPPAMTWRDGLS